MNPSNRLPALGSIVLVMLEAVWAGLVHATCVGLRAFKDVRRIWLQLLVSDQPILTDGGNSGLWRGQQERTVVDESTALSRDVVELIHFVSQETRYTLIANMLAHPKQTPSLKELQYLYPDKGRTTIVEALEKLVEWGFVDKLVIPPGDRSRSLPSSFYRVSDVGHRFLEQVGLLPDERQLKQQYQQLPLEEVRRYEEAPRQDAVVDYSEVDEQKAAQLKAIVDASAPGTDEEGESVVEILSGFVHELFLSLASNRQHLTAYRTRKRNSGSGRSGDCSDNDEERKRLRQ